MGQDPMRACFQGSELAWFLFNEAGDALLIVEPAEGRVVEVNATTARLTRESREALLNQPVRALVRHERGEEGWLEAVRVTGTFPGQDGFQLRTANPEVWVPVSLAVSRLPTTGDEPLALITLEDRSESVEASRRLRESESEQRRLLDRVSDCLWSGLVDGQGRVRYHYLSPVVQRLTGRPVRHFLEAPDAWQHVVDPEDLPRWQESRARVCTGAPAEVEYRVRQPDGGCVWVRESVLASTAEQGERVLHGVLTDVTAVKQAEQAALERQALAAQKQESLASLAGHLAHDLNNLITAILGHTSLGRLTCPPESPALQALNQIESITARAADLSKQMLLCAGKGQQSGERQDVNALVRDAVELVRPLLSRKAHLVMDLSDAQLLVQGDHSQLRQMVVNLLTNACEALGSQEGQVTLTTRPQRSSSLRRDEGFLGDLSDGEYVVLEVRDTGEGIPAEVRGRIFDPFFTTRPGGRGLGLAAVLGIVRGHKGAVRVESRPGQGASFQVLLPQSLGAGPVVQSGGMGSGQYAVTPSWRGEGTVLVVDDEDTIRDVATRLLQVIGFQTVVARDGLEALERLREHKEAIRLVLLDLTMPHMDGEGTFRELLRIQPGLQVILMSGYPESEVMDRVSRAALAGYLQKPFRLPTLTAAVRSCLEPASPTT